MYDQVDELRSRAGELPYGSAQVALLEEAVELADSMNDEELAYETRQELMQAASFSGRPDILLIAFSWCLARLDRDPDEFDIHGMLWKYKWVINNALHFPEISRSRIEDLLADMERRYREWGSTMNAIWLERRGILTRFGEWQMAREAHAEFRKRRRDSLSDCEACVAGRASGYFSAQRQWGRAIQAAQPVLRKRLACAEQPHHTLATVLKPLLNLGRLEEAKTYQQWGYRLVASGKQFVGQHAEHLRFSVLTGDLAKAKRMLERHLPGALETVLVDERFEFFLAARLWAERLVRRGTRTAKVRLPEGSPAPDADGKSDVGALGAWFAAEAQTIAGRFDARNGTNAFQRQIEEVAELAED